MIDKKILNIETPFKNAALFICSKCSDKSEGLRAELKPLLKEKYDKSIRCMISSCQGICPENKIAITKFSQGEINCFKSYEVNPDITAQELLTSLF